MRDPVLIALGAVAAVYAALVLPSGEVDPCRAVLARALRDNPAPVAADLLSRAVMADAVAAWERALAERHKAACFAGLIQMAAGYPPTVLRR